MSEQAESPKAQATTKRPTQRTIAELTGLAVTTVSRALAGDEKISEKTRKLVADVAKQVGYVPDRAAQRLRTGRTQVIALVLDPHSEILGFADSMITGLTEGLSSTQYHLVLMQYSLGEDPMTPVRNIVRHRLADGIVLARTRQDDPRVEFLNAAGFPFVTHGRTAQGCHPWLDYDNALFAKMAVDRLISRGRSNIAMLGPSPRFTFSDHMRRGFFEAVKNAGVKGFVPEALDLHTSATEITDGVKQLLEFENPDAWICPGEIATLAVSAALIDSGREIGAEVDIVSKQTSEVFSLFRPEIDSIREDITAAGRDIAGLLLASIRGDDPGNLNRLHAPLPNF